jgi:hypothetical protein
MCVKTWVCSNPVGQTKLNIFALLARDHSFEILKQLITIKADMYYKSLPSALLDVTTSRIAYLSTTTFGYKKHNTI